MVRVGTDIPEDTPVVVTVLLHEQTAVLFGRVRHSTQSVGAHKIGIELHFEDAEE
jgi:hypothetical protein